MRTTFDTPDPVLANKAKLAAHMQRPTKAMPQVEVTAKAMPAATDCCQCHTQQQSLGVYPLPAGTKGLADAPSLTTCSALHTGSNCT